MGYLVDGSIAAGHEHHIIAVGTGLSGKLSGMVWPLGLGRHDQPTRGRQHGHGVRNFAPCTTPAGCRVIHQKLSLIHI